MEIPVGIGKEDEFQSTYGLLNFGKKTLASPMVALGFPGLPGTVERLWNNMDTHLKKLDSYYHLLKVNIAVSASTNGEHFLQPLRDCMSLLVTTVAIIRSKSILASSTSPTPAACSANMSLIEVSSTGKAHLHTIYNFITEKLVFHFSKVHQSKKEMGLFMLDVLCLIMTLDEELCATFPQTFSSCLLFFKPSTEWAEASREVVDRLCYYVLPKCLMHRSEDFPCVTMSATIMMVLDGCLATKDHLLVTSTLMQLKRDVCLDVLSAIAYGTVTVRQKAVDLLFHYWPIPIPEFSQRSNTTFGEWTTPVCENSGCQHKNSVASMICLDPLCVTHKQVGPTKLYRLLCPECDRKIHCSPLIDDRHVRLRVPRPLHDVKPNCEFQKICSGKDRQVNRAEVTCYDDSCTAIQHGQPIRMCRDCHNKQHKDLDDPFHIYQVCPPDPWLHEDSILSSVMLEAVSKLLEITPTLKPVSSRGPQNVNVPSFALIEVGISREGLWMLHHYCTPSTKVGDDQKGWLVHLVAVALNWLKVYCDLLQDTSASSDEGSSAGLGGCVSGAVAELQTQGYSRLFSNYTDISNLVNSYMLPWLCCVCECNTECVTEVLKPELCDSAQAGQLWNQSHDRMKRYGHTLSIIHTLNLFFQAKKISEHIFMELFKQVMPLWMDLLTSLREEPGKMELLQDHIRRIFYHETHEEGLKLFGFVWDFFRAKDTKGMKKALFWLQDLTRLKVPIAYLRHMFEEALMDKHSNKLGQKGRGRYAPINEISSFDHEAARRTESTDSHDSESALLSESLVGIGGLINLNSSLTRFILMLDIWLSQLLEKNVSTLEACALYDILVKMLHHVWGSNHTFLDHRDPSANLCLLCHGMELWFSLATKLVEEYCRRERESSADECVDDVSCPLASRPSSVSRSVKIMEKISTPIRKRRLVSAFESPQIQIMRPKLKKMSQDFLVKPMEVDSFNSICDERTSGGGGGASGGGASGKVATTSMQAEHPRSNTLQLPTTRRQFRPRKVAKVQSHSNLEVVSSFGGGGGEPIPPVIVEEAEEEQGVLPSLYIVFQLSIESFGSKLHQDTILHILQWLYTLIQSSKVLETVTDKKIILDDLKKLFEKLWRGLETDTSNVARSCVGLLLLCADYIDVVSTSMAGGEMNEVHEDGGAKKKTEDDGDTVKSKLDGKDKRGKRRGEKDGIFWQTLSDGLTTKNWSTRFRTIGKLMSILQFMLSSEVVGMEHQNFNVKLKHNLAHGFCLLTQLLLDKNSNVCSRARYCITSIKESSLEVTRSFLTLFFRESPAHRNLVFQSLSLLDSVLPEIHFLNLEMLNRLMGVAIHGNTIVSKETDILPIFQKKVSESSILSGASIQRVNTPKTSTTSSTCPLFEGEAEKPVETAALRQQILSLLLRHIGNPRANVKASMDRAQQAVPQPHKKGATIKKSSSPSSSEEVFVLLFRRYIFDDLECLPHELRKNLLLEVFLNHIFLVLDRNTQFGQTKGLLIFILQLLCYSAAPCRDDFRKCEPDERYSMKQEPSYGLAYLPTHLQAPWLRVLFVVLYKYIHNCSDYDQNKIYFHSLWCMLITLNSLEYSSRDSQSPTIAMGQMSKHILQRQAELNSFTADILPGSPQTEATLFGEKSSMQRNGGREKGGMSAVPEYLEGSSWGEDGDRGRRGGEGRVEGGSQPMIHVDSSSNFNKDALASIPPTQDGCVVCETPTNDMSEEVVTLCTVALGTFCNRLPHMVPRYLVARIIPAISKVLNPGFFSWQKFEVTSNPVPGSASSVASHLLASILTEFGERRLFLYLFGYNHGKLKEAVFAAMACSLDDAEGEIAADQPGGGGGGSGGGGGGGGGGGDKDGEQRLYRSSPIKYLLEDAIISSHFNQDVSRHTLVNLATYLTALTEAPPSQLAGSPAPPILLTRDLVLWEAFFMKLKTHYVVLKDKMSVISLFQVIITLFQYTLDCTFTQYALSTFRVHNFQSVIQSLISILETALHNVYCPLGGIVMLAGMWYKVFQGYSQRESEKLIKMYIFEIRKALKANRGSLGEVVRSDNFLCLIQVLLLDENGYLGYVEGLTHVMLFAPDLKMNFETHCLSVIQSSPQWDFNDALHFLCRPSFNLAPEMVPQLKLSLAQLIALRVQHRRTPLEKLRRMVDGDFKALISSDSKSADSNTSHWRAALQALHILSWLILGALSHNMVHSVASDVRSVPSSGGQLRSVASSAGQCRLLDSLCLTKMEELVQRAISLTKTVLQRVISNVELELRFDRLEMTFMFAGIFTVYLELYVPKSGSLVLEYWEKVCGCLSHQLASSELDSTVCNEVIYSLNEQVVTRIKMLDLSCFILLLPVWQELAVKSLPDRKLTLAWTGLDSTHTPLNIWFDTAVSELYRIEIETIQT